MKNLMRAAGREIFGKLLPRRAYPVVRGQMRGARFVLGALEGAGGGGSVYFDLVEPEQTKVFAENIKANDVFFDVGANVGYYTVFGSRLVGEGGRVVAFEPVVRNLAHLYRHIAVNKLKNVSVIPSACSDEISLAAFSSGQNTAMGHLESDSQKSARAEDLTLVSTVTLDAVAGKLGLTPNAIKIDVEGAELAVLRGAKEKILPAKPKIFLSLHSEKLRADCLAYLENFGYKFEPLGADENDAMEFLCSAD
jgi:FkbM family methyltransferase